MMTKCFVTHKPFIKGLTMYAYSDSQKIYLTHADKMYDRVKRSIILAIKIKYKLN